jgi:flagellar protein FliS
MMSGADNFESSVRSPQPAEIPEHMVVLLLEAAQRFLGKAEETIQSQDPLLRDFYLKKVLAILLELTNRLNGEAGGELVINLIRIYDWWGREVVDGGEQNDIARLKSVSSQMGDIRKAWDQVLFQGQGMSENPDF